MNGDRRTVIDPVTGLDHDGSLRDAPTAEFIAALRGAYDIEPEWDAVLTRKLLRRHEPRRPPTGLEDLAACLDAFLAAHVAGHYEVSNHRWLSGGASKLQFAFTLSWTDPETGELAVTELVARLDPQESMNTTSRLREEQILRAVADVLPVPRVLWVDAKGNWFPEPALIYTFVAGVTKPRDRPGQVAGVGGDFGPDLRPVLAEQFMDHLTKLHRMEPEESKLPAFRIPRSGTPEAARWELDRVRRLWEEDRDAEFPLIDVAAAWLARHLPDLDQASVIHGDFRTGNFLFDERSTRITAWLDWERAAVGDRHRDLAWITLPQAGHLAEDGETFLVSGLVPQGEFYKWYEEASGLGVDPVRLHYYRVLNTFQIVVTLLGSAYRVVRLGRSHQDVLLAWLEGAAYMTAENLRLSLLEEPDDA